MIHGTALRRRHARGPSCAAIVLGFAIALILIPVAASADAPQAQPADSPYIGADACKACHAAEHESWAKSKHAASFHVLSDVNAADDSCIGCHATGVADDLRNADGSPHLPGTQCEACHGPGRAHAVAATQAAGNARATGKTLNTKPDTRVCERCHNRQSPRFQGFVYGPMARLVHVHPGR
jgi:hypothetical protein